MTIKKRKPKPTVCPTGFGEMKQLIERNARSLAMRINRKLRTAATRTGQLGRSLGCLLFFGGGALLCLLLCTGKCNGVKQIHPVPGMQTLHLAPMLPARIDTPAAGPRAGSPDSPYRDTLKRSPKDSD